MEKCHHCKRKDILIECKCGLKVCLKKCKVPESHGCKFDYRLNTQYRLAINNPTVTAKKIELI